MALNATVLGPLLRTKAENFNDVVVDTTDAAAMENYRNQFWTAIAEGIIEHLTSAGVVTVPGAGLTAGSNPVTGTATGTIS